MTATWADPTVSWADPDWAWSGSEVAVSYSVEIAFAVDPGSEPADADWTDITGYVDAVDISRGRQHELERVEAGTAQLTIDNSDRRFDPTNSNSPYHPDVVPMRHVRVRAHRLGSTHDVFRGFVEGWPVEFSYRLSVVDVPCVDAFKVLANQTSGGQFPVERSDERIGRLLDLAGWPSGKRDLAEGQTRLAAKDSQSANLLRAILDVADAEHGIFYLDAAGNARFVDRHAFLTPRSDVTAVFDDDGLRPPEHTVLEFDESRLLNDITIVTADETEHTAEDATSQQRYMRRDDRQEHDLDNHWEGKDRADYLLSRLADPAVRISEISYQPLTNHRLWKWALGLSLGDRVTVIYRPQVGDPVERELIIEHIHHRAQDVQWVTTWQLSPADTRDFFTLDHDTLGILDEPNLLAY